MKCSNCGHELEPGSGFCENCGMIISLDAEPDVPDAGKEEQTSRDVYSGSPQVQEEEPSTDFPIPEAESDLPRELEADATEQIVPVVEYPEKDEEQTAEEPTDGSDIYVADSRIETSEFEDEEEPPEDEDGIADDSDRDTVSEEDGAREYESDFDGEDEEEPLEEDQDEEDEEDDEEDDDLDDMYVASSKSKRNSVIIAVLLVILVAVTAGAITMIKNHIGRVPVDVPVTEAQSTTVQKESATTKPVKDAESETKDETTEETEDETTLPETTEEATTQKETEKETEKETTKKAEQAVTEPSKETTKKPSVSESATKRETTKPSTTKSTTTKPTTTKPTTTKPTTTKPTTTKPTTTKPTTTKPTTTKPSTTTDPYGFGTDEVQKPAVYLNTKDRYTVYVAVDSLTVRNKPSQSGSKVVYVSLGEALTVYGKKQDGFVYVRSNRYGVYGWVAEKYISKSRPVTDSVVVVPGIVEPDKQFASPKTMYVKADIGIRLRKAPDKDAASVRSLSYGFPVKVTGYSSKNSGWVYVTDVTHGVTGWTRLEWLANKV